MKVSEQFGEDVSKIIVNIQDGNNTIDSLARVLKCSTAELVAKLGLLEIEGLAVVEGERIRLLK